jgi:ribosomal protein S12
MVGNLDPLLVWSMPLRRCRGSLVVPALDPQGVNNRKQARSRYGAKKEKS